MCGTILHHEGCPLGSVLELIFKTQLEGEVKSFLFDFFYMDEEKGEWGERGLPFYTWLL